jgi:hypothetical protein
MGCEKERERGKGDKGDLKMKWIEIQLAGGLFF